MTGEKSIAERLIESEGQQIVLTIDGDEYSGYVDHIDYAPHIDRSPWAEEGELMAYIDLHGDVVDEYGFISTQLSAMAQEERPGEWTELNAAVWSPEVEDGTVIEDGWEALGTIEDLENDSKGEN